MSEQEGVIKYRLDHHYCSLPAEIDIHEINAWRTILFRLQLIGRLPEKYDGLGFGNLSYRLTPKQNRFLISGTQTGHLANLQSTDFTVVDTASPVENTLCSHGPCQPSSEALTHASVYQHNADAMAVIHVHCPELWRDTHTLSIPHIGSHIAYGSVEMALAVERLLKSGQLETLPLFSMLGHEDGIVVYGDSLASAAQTLLKTLARAIAVEHGVNCH